MNVYLALLQRRPQYRYLWLAQVVSLLGDWFNTIATVILVNRYTDSGLAVSALFMARGLPPFLFGPLAGVAADRLNRKAILVTSDLLRAGIVLGLLLVDSSSRVWLVYVLVTSQFIVSAFFEPARAAILPSLIQHDELLTANTLGSATWSAVLAFGAAIGGVTAAVFGIRTALIFDSLTFLVSALLLWRVVPVFIRPVEKLATPTSGWADFVNGLRYVSQRPRIGVYTFVKGMAQVGSVDIMFALYAEKVFVVGDGGAITLGILYTFFGIGAVVGPVIGNHLGDGGERFLRRWIWIGFVLLPLGWFGFGIAPVLAIAAVAIAFRGMGGSINWTYSSVMLQLKVPDNFLGRVFALDFSIFTLGYAVSVWATGLLVDGLDINPRVLALWLAMGGMLPVLLWTTVLRIFYRAEQPVTLAAEGD